MSLDTYELARCVELRFLDSGSTSEPDSSIYLRLTSDHGVFVGFTLRGVRSIHVPDGGPHIWVPEFEILDLRGDQLHGIRFLVQSQMGEGVRIYCADVEVSDFTSRDSVGS